MFEHSIVGDISEAGWGKLNRSMERMGIMLRNSVRHYDLAQVISRGSWV